ncbi:MAG TPA: tetratricopeptide repeat protein [Candidatus Binatia bacterium]|nr:tetratricopeptide repeat protein [Candidatus Binatia bacterium]
MPRRQIIAMGLLLGVVALALAYRLYEYETKPFDPIAFASLAVAKGYVVNYDPQFHDSSTVVHINQPYRPPEHFHEAYAYFIDSDRIAKDWRVPWAWKEEMRSTLWDNGRAFFAERIVIMDGGITRRSYAIPSGRMPSMPELAIGSGKMDRPMFLEFMFLHELTHLTDTKYMLPDAIPAGARESYNGGVVAMSSGDFEKARNLYKLAIEEFRWYPDALDNLGLVERRMGQPDEALACYARSLDIDPSGEIALRNTIAALADKGDLPGALAATANLERILPQNPEGPFWRGLLLVGEGNYALAIPALEQARRMYGDQKNPAVLDADALRVRTYRQLHNAAQLATATADLKDSCRRFPDRGASLKECAALLGAAPGK